jgi:hypothetical protein
MCPICREPGYSTMIRVSIEIHDYLKKQRKNDQEALGDVVERIIKENKLLMKAKEP